MGLLLYMLLGFKFGLVNRMGKNVTSPQFSWGSKTGAQKRLFPLVIVKVKD